MCRDMGFDTAKRFHCPYVIGIRGESLRHVFRTYFAILKAGGRPTPFPLSPAPGTREYRLHERWLRGKDLSEVKWADAHRLRLSFSRREELDMERIASRRQSNEVWQSCRRQPSACLERR